MRTVCVLLDCVLYLYFHVLDKQEWQNVDFGIVAGVCTVSFFLLLRSAMDGLLFSGLLDKTEYPALNLWSSIAQTSILCPESECRWLWLKLLLFMQYSFVFLHAYFVFEFVGVLSH